MVMSRAKQEVTLFVEGDALYDAMLARAQQSIRLESYFFADDEIGSRFIDVLGGAAQSGIDIGVPHSPRRSAGGHGVGCDCS